MKVKAILLDWDGTLCNGYTLERWMQFLNTYGIIKRSYTDEFTQLTQVYQNLKLSYDEFVERSGKIYAASLNGKEHSEIKQLAENFVENEKEQVFLHTYDLFRYVNQQASVMLISGAPEEVLSVYLKKYNLQEIYALNLDVEGGKYTGAVKENYGLLNNKKSAVRVLRKKYDIILSAGDTSSDLPLLESSTYRIIVNHEKLIKKYTERTFLINTQNYSVDNFKTFLHQVW